MKKNKWIGVGVVGVIAASVAIFLALKTKKIAPPQNDGQPLKSLEAILNERNKQALQHLDAPLGKAILTKDWLTVQKIYHPETQFLEFAEVVRALFIEGKMNDFSPDDQKQILSFMLGTFEAIPEKNYHLAGLLITQFLRFPAPPQDSLNYQRLLDWMEKDSEPNLRRRLAIQKLALHDARPNPKALLLFREATIAKDAYGASQGEWIQFIGDMRNEKERNLSLEYLAHHLSKVPETGKPQALITLSHSPEVAPKETKQLLFQFLKSEKPAEFESALRAIPFLYEAKAFSASEKELILKTLNTMPSQLKTPFATAKAAEIMQKIK